MITTRVVLTAVLVTICAGMQAQTQESAEARQERIRKHKSDIEAIIANNRKRKDSLESSSSLIAGRESGRKLADRDNPTFSQGKAANGEDPSLREEDERLMSREERILAHQKRIRKIISENRELQRESFNAAISLVAGKYSPEEFERTNVPILRKGIAADMQIEKLRELNRQLWELRSESDEASANQGTTKTQALLRELQEVLTPAQVDAFIAAQQK